VNPFALSLNGTEITQRIEIFVDPISRAEKLVGGAADDGSRQVGRGSNHHLLLVVVVVGNTYSGV